MDDLIKRSDAIKAILQKPAIHGSEGSWYHADDIRDALNAVPSADRPQGEWIPCSERLPEIGQKVLASTKKTVFTQVFKGYYSDPNKWVWENNSVKTIEAWQLLPKPWKGVNDEKSV